ncbi:MAG: hypothetical protein IJ454_02600 [Clostridia bacterium]|nr:hypothetical protein [Clostridia bacterium]
MKFILQPIVENALQHGIHPVENIHGKIVIESKIADKQLMIKVRNNGKPIPPDELREIRDNLRLDDMPENHIGLYNVNQRIKIIYGDRYGCRIHSDKNGTTVTVLQPIK